MPTVDLKPDDYRVQTKRGRFINRDNWRFNFIYAAIIGGGFLVYAWWYRAELPSVMLYGTSGVVGLLVGIGIGGWLKRFD